MAVEKRRGCGYRKMGGLYLVSGKLGAPCCRLPLPLHVCPTCSQGIKQARGWAWIDPVKLFGSENSPPTCFGSAIWAACPLGDVGGKIGNAAGLLWIGGKFYPTTESFAQEAAALGVSRRIGALPRGFVVGKTWVFLAHARALEPGLANDQTATAGVFRVFLPERIEKIVKLSEFNIIAAIQARKGSGIALDVNAEDFREFLPLTPADALRVIESFNAGTGRGIKWVPGPADDPDHQGTVHDDDETNGGNHVQDALV